jgi:hypothetical protein
MMKYIVISLGNELNLEIDYSVDIDISYDAPREEY